jgi:c-di-GMP-related signal transduction protein
VATSERRLAGAISDDGSVELMRIFVARQPIFDHRQQVVAYEFRFRSHDENSSVFPEGSYASRAELSEALRQFGFDQLTQGKKAFISFTRASLAQQVPTLLPSDQVAIEIPVTLEPDGEMLSACRVLEAGGYTLVLDDLLTRTGYERLIALADIIKVDFVGATKEQRQEFAQRFAPRRIKLLAENVDTWEDFREALHLGYDFFKGSFYTMPEMVARKDIPVSKLNHLRFLREINQPEVDLNRLEELIKKDVGLSAKLLRYANSAWFGFAHRVYSLRHALALLGTDAVRQWASVVTVSGIGHGKPAELVALSLLRARFCERLAPLVRMRGRESDLFLVGLLSLLDAMTGRPLSEVLAEIAVPAEVRDALQGSPDRISQVYGLVKAYEQANWSTVALLAEMLDVDQDRLPEVYQQALEWISHVLSE